MLANCEVPVDIPIKFHTIFDGRIGYRVIECEHKFIPHPRSVYRIFCEKCGEIRD